MPINDPSGCLPALLKLFGFSTSDNSPHESLPYRRKDYLLTKAEHSFFTALQQAVGHDYLLFAKVRLGDLVWIPKGTQSRQSHLNRVQSKHIDFLLCSHDFVRPVLAIELDDSSHTAEARQSRDAFVNEALSTAGLPLLRFPCKAAYNANEIKTQIRAAIS